MKKFLFSLVFVCALAVSSFGQSASDCTISGNLYDSFNDPLVGFTFTATVTRRDGVPVAYSPKTVTTTSGGAISFTVPRKSFVLIRGSFTVGRYDFRNGLLMFIPDEATKAITDLQSVEDAAAALVAVSAAPSDAQYVVGTANGTLSAEQSLGALTTGLLKNTVSGSTGTLSTAVAGTDYVAPGGALGTPSSGTLTNATGLPPTTGIVGWPANSAGVLTNNGSGTLTWAAGGGAGTVTSVAQSFTGGLISVSGSPVTTSGTLALTVAGTSGGIPYFDSASSWASSGVLAANALVIGGGAGVAPSTITTGTGVVTALGVNVGGAGAFVVNGGALGTPSSGTLTNATGLPVATGISGLGTGVATALGVNTGSAGAFVVLGGALGTPSSGTATNITGLPISTGVSGLGTGIATALGVNVGSAGAPVLFDGAGGTPSSINLTNGTALPLSTGVSGDLPFANFVQAGSAGFVGATGAGDYSHRTPTQVTAALDNFVGDSGSGGTKGLVPAPSAGDAAANKYLKADGTWATVSAGGGITVGTTTVTSGTATRLFYETAGNVVGQVSGVTSDGTNVTAGSGNLRATSPQITTGINDANGNTMLAFSPTGSATQYLTIANNTATNAVSLTANAPTVAASAQAGTPFNLTASAATAGNTNVGAAVGGSVTITAGAAARLTSGNANGGNIVLVTGAGIGTGTAGQVLIPNGTAAAPSLAFSATTNAGIYADSGLLNFSVGGLQIARFHNAGNTGLDLMQTSGMIRFGNSLSPILRRNADAHLSLGNTDAASPVAQTLSVQGGTGTNVAGATWTLRGSLGTSQGAPGRIHLTGGALSETSGTTQQTAVDRIISGAAKVLTNNSATTILNVTNASNTNAGGVLDYCVEVFDATNVQYECGMVTYGISNKGGVFSGNTVTKFGNHQNATSGTLTVTFAISAANPGALSVNANSSLSPSSGYPRITYSLRNLTQQAVSVQ